jgi:hypothetical protein
MNKIKCLIFDDEDISVISNTLNQNWLTLSKHYPHLPELETQEVDDKEAARKILQTPGHGFQLFLCDILVPNKKGISEMHGLSLIRLAKSGIAIPVVIGLSKGPDKTHAGDFYGKIIDAGVDEHFEKSPFESNSGLEMTERIVRYLEVKGLLRYQGVLNREIGQENSETLDAAYTKIGQINLSPIASYFCFNRSAENVYLSALKPGLSGADVLVARYSSSNIDLSRKGVLLKISRDPERLKQEFELYENEIVGDQKFSSSLIVDYLSMVGEHLEANLSIMAKHS